MADETDSLDRFSDREYRYHFPTLV